MSVDASDLYSIERKLERVADELRRRNEIEAQKLDLLKQIEKNPIRTRSRPMTVIQYCREKTNVRELVIIREGGWVTCAAFIDHEDLFRLPPSIARAEVIGEECGQIRLANREGGFEDAPCVYLDI